MLIGIKLFTSLKNLRSKLGIYAHTTVDDPTKAYLNLAVRRTVQHLQGASGIDARFLNQI